MLKYKAIAVKIFYYLFVIFAVTLNISNIKIIAINSLIPCFEIATIFYSIAMNNIFGLWFVFIVGIWSDSVNSTHLGISYLCYIIVIKFFHLLYEKIFIKENFSHILMHFSFFIFLFQFLKISFLIIIDKHFYDISRLLIQSLLTIAIYPMLHYFFDYLDNKIE